jgi:phosphinothricin acetyltransferase
LSFGKENRVSGVTIRPAGLDDLPRLTEIYNHYVLHSPATFDLEPKTLDQRREWFAQFATTGRHRLLVADEAGLVLGYAGTMRWRPKPAYDTTVEAKLYAALFEALAGEQIHRVVAGYVPPNPASAALHERVGFKPVGTFGEVGSKFGQYWDVCWLERPLRVG